MENRLLCCSTNKCCVVKIIFKIIEKVFRFQHQMFPIWPFGSIIIKKKHTQEKNYHFRLIGAH